MFIRKSAIRVKEGTVQKKNRHTKTPNYWNTYQDDIQIDVENPGKDFKHFLKKRDIKLFLEILPNREEIDFRFDAVVLTYGSHSLDGWYRNGVIGICAWVKSMSREMNKEYFEDHKAIFEKLNVKYTMKEDFVMCDFTENQIKAFQLLHILLHEIGHHHDRINTKKKSTCGRGEKYAESYAYKYEQVIWNEYFKHFPLV